MIAHVVLFRWKPDTDPTQIAQLAKHLATLPAAIPQLTSYDFGSDLRLRPDNADFAVVALLENTDDVIDYLDHPAHRDLIRTHVMPILAEHWIAQFAVTPRPTERDPGLA